MLLRVTLWVPTVSGPYCLGSLLSISFCELISRARVYSIRCVQGPYCPAHNVNRCGAMPFPTRRWFNRFRVSHCRIQESQLRSFEIKQKNLNSTQVFSLTHSLTFPLRKRTSTEEKTNLPTTKPTDTAHRRVFILRQFIQACVVVGPPEFWASHRLLLVRLPPCTRQLLGCLPYTH